MRGREQLLSSTRAAVDQPYSTGEGCGSCSTWVPTRSARLAPASSARLGSSLRTLLCCNIQELSTSTAYLSTAVRLSYSSLEASLTRHPSRSSFRPLLGRGRPQNVYYSTMNIFRLLGDLSHLASILILVHKITKSRSCRGISFKTQLCYLIVFLTRWAPLIFLRFAERQLLMRCTSADMSTSSPAPPSRFITL